uniref:Variant surface glycoprotein 658 n=1 Tax=Trypanosoma brucei TaxID=5691 RepID=M4SYN6_9TRYP|nr:variant surface glycoprotein 658 [Trypanosoma brucei]
MANKKALIEATALLIATASVVHSTNKAPPKVEAMSKVCTFSEAMKAVSSYAARLSSERLKAAISLSNLQDQLEATVTENEGTSDIKTVLLIQYLEKSSKDLLSASADATTSGIHAAAVCANLAGRVEEFVHLFYQMHNNAANSCIHKGGGRQHTDLACMATDTALKELTTQATDAPKPDVGGLYKAIAASGAALTGGGIDTCKIMDGQAGSNTYLDNHGGPKPLKFGHGMLTVTTDNSDITGANWEPNGKDDISKGAYKACGQALTDLATTETAETTKALAQAATKLLEDGEPQMQKIEIAKNAIHAGLPAEKVEYSTDELKTLHAALKAYRKDSIKQHKSMVLAHHQHIQATMKLNRTACDLGLKNPKPCEASDTTTDSQKKAEKECKTANDDKEACDKLEAQGCAFNEQDKKCELKKEVKEKVKKGSQETVNSKTTNTTGSNSFVINKTPLLLAVLLF